MVPCLHQDNVYIKFKGSYGCGEPKNVISAINPLAVTGLQTIRFHSAPYMADIGNFGKFGTTYSHGTVFAPRQCLYQVEATGVGSLKM